MNSHRFSAICLICVVSCFFAPQLAAQQLVDASPTPQPTPDLDLQKLYHTEWLTRPENQSLKEGVDTSQLSPFVSAQTLIKSQTTWARSANFGRDSAARRAAGRQPGLADRAAALIEPRHLPLAEDPASAIRAAAFSYLIGIKPEGFAAKTSLKFLALGDLDSDPSPEMMAIMQRAAESWPKPLDVKILPVSRSMTGIEDAGAIRDRVTGEIGMMLRVGDVLIQPDGSARVIASYSFGDHMVPTEVLEFQKKGGSWVVADSEPLQPRQKR